MMVWHRQTPIPSTILSPVVRGAANSKVGLPMRMHAASADRATNRSKNPIFLCAGRARNVAIAPFGCGSRMAKLNAGLKLSHYQAEALRADKSPDQTLA